MSENYFAQYLGQFGGDINNYSQSFINEVNEFIEERLETKGLCFCNEISDNFPCLNGYHRYRDGDRGFCAMDPNYKKWDWEAWKEDLKNTELFKEKEDV